MVRIARHADITSLARQIAGLETAEGLDPWRSRVRALARAVTFLENDPDLAAPLLSHPAFDAHQDAKLQAKHPPARIIGLTGLPGAGKSTLTNLLTQEYRRRGLKVAVFAVDPSSSLSGGAILGDRIRMQEHFRDEGVFIRSMGSRGALGGVARATRGAIRLATLLGFDLVLVETVGIGQSESEITDLADTTALVLMPNSGDEIQLMKAGVLQLADIFVVNKCDLSDASRMLAELADNAHIATAGQAGAWTPPAIGLSALRGEGLFALTDAIDAHARWEGDASSLGQKTRIARARREVMQALLHLVEGRMREAVAQLPDALCEEVLNGRMPAMRIASDLLHSGTQDISGHERPDHKGKP